MKMVLSAYCKKVLVGLIALVYMIVCLFLIPDLYDYLNVTQWCKSITIYLIILLTIQLYFLQIVMPKRRGIMYFVLILFYVFHFSHIILYGLDYDFGSNERNSVFFRFSDTVVVRATLIEIKTIISIYIGIVLCFIFVDNSRRVFVDGGGVKTDLPKSFAILLLFVGLSADLSINISAMIASLSGGYLNIISGEMHYIVRVISFLLLPGVLLILQREEYSPRIKKNLLFVFILYKIVFMFSGLRAYSLISIILILYIYYRVNSSQKITIKMMIFILLSIQLGGGLIVGIRETRIYGIDFDIIMEYMLDWRSNIIFNMMSEFGITQNVICEILEQTNGIANGGTQLLSSFLIVIPWISQLSSINFLDMTAEDSLDIHNYGGTYLGDMLFDYGSEGVIFSGFIFGIIFAMFFEYYEKLIFIKNRYLVAIMSPIVVECIYSVRSSLAKLPRMVVWYLLVFFVLKYLFGTRWQKIINGK